MVRSEINWFNSHWFILFVFLYGVFVGLPFLAPVLMQIGWAGPGRALYFVYSFFCHQLPQRSFHALPPTFYVGDSLGSFNSWVRLLTGTLFGLGIVWLGFPYIHEWIEAQISVNRHPELTSVDRL